MARPSHLARRYLTSLSRRRPSPEDEQWALGNLNAGEQRLWAAMPAFDQRHAIGVAHRALDACPDAARPVVAAALLHDVGKIDGALGVHARVVATLVGVARGRARVAAGSGRVARYLDHAAIGARLLRDAGADPLTVAWAAEHHQPESAWTVPIAIGRVLRDADDD